MMTSPKRDINKWRTFFYSLLGFNLLIFFVFIILIFWPVSENDINDDVPTQKEGSEFILRTTKQNLNDLINAYLEQTLVGSKHQYRIALDRDVHLMGELPAFSTTIPLSVHLEPFVDEHGNIILKQRSISIGLLELPNQKIMQYMAKYLDMPDWVTINPKQEEIYVAVTEIDVKSNVTIKVEHLDLEANHIALRLKVPYETLGIDDYNKKVFTR